MPLNTRKASKYIGWWPTINLQLSTFAKWAWAKRTKEQFMLVYILTQEYYHYVYTLTQEYIHGDNAL